MRVKGQSEISRVGCEPARLGWGYLLAMGYLSLGRLTFVAATLIGLSQELVQRVVTVIDCKGPQCIVEAHCEVPVIIQIEICQVTDCTHEVAGIRAAFY